MTLRHSMVSVVLAALAIGLTACGDIKLSWEEEVKLANGDVITATRGATRNRTGELGHRGRPTSWSIEISRPINVLWRSEGGTLPVIFDIYDNKVYVAVLVSIGADCFLHKSPSNGVVFYRYDGTWMKIAEDAFPKSFDTNLLLNVWNVNPDQDVRGKITLEEKEKRDRLVQARSLRDWIEKFGKKSCAN